MVGSRCRRAPRPRSSCSPDGAKRNPGTSELLAPIPHSAALHAGYRHCESCYIRRMKILLLGGGGREHALAWKIAASPLTTKLWCAPGNAGIAQEAECVPVDLTDHAAVIALAKKLAVDFVVVGPDNPLVAGIVDDLEAAGLRTFGPTKAAARLEGSKGFTKDLCGRYGIPTAAYQRFSDAASAKAYVKAQGAPIVVKADGLALGKGVVVAQSLAEAEAAIDMMFGGAFGASGNEVVIEEFLAGEEVSFFRSEEHTS